MSIPIPIDVIIDVFVGRKNNVFFWVFCGEVARQCRQASCRPVLRGSVTRGRQKKR
jgi:hypothetical protein